MSRSMMVPWGAGILALAAATTACSRSMAVWQAPGLEEPPKTLTPLAGVPFFVKMQRYKHTKSEEHRWYRVKLTATPLFEAPPKSGGPSRAEGAGTGTAKGTLTVHVLDIGRDKRSALLEALAEVRSVKTPTSRIAPPEA